VLSRTVPGFRVVLPSELVKSLIRHAGDLPDWKLDSDGLLTEEIASQYISTLIDLPHVDEFVTTCSLLLDSPVGDGFAVIEFAPLLAAAATEEEGLRVVTALVSLIATPHRAFERWPLWKPLGTNLTIDPMRATGAGYNPMHIDIVNSTLPPDYSALLCVRPDPQGQGHSLVSQTRRAVERLSYEHQELLKEAHYSDGAFFDLNGVGLEWNPFPILDGLPDTEGFVRFTAKMLADADPDLPAIQAARALDRELQAGQQRFLLGAGDMLVVNQHLCCHGREALGGGQADVPEDQRRLLLQIFLRQQEAAA
jgi:hypothetical protein